MKQIGDGACTAPWPLQMEWLLIVLLLVFPLAPEERKLVWIILCSFPYTTAERCQDRLWSVHTVILAFGKLWESYSTQLWRQSMEQLNGWERKGRKWHCGPFWVCHDLFAGLRAKRSKVTFLSILSLSWPFRSQPFNWWDGAFSFELSHWIVSRGHNGQNVFLLFRSITNCWYCMFSLMHWLVGKRLYGNL